MAAAKSKSEAKRVAAQSAGEAKSATAATPPGATGQPINEAKVLKLMQMMFPGAQKAASLQDAVTLLLAEYDRLKRANADLEKAVPGPKINGDAPSGEVLAGIQRIEASLKQFKEQLSTMRQYGIKA